MTSVNDTFTHVENIAAQQRTVNASEILASNIFADNVATTGALGASGELNVTGTATFAGATTFATNSITMNNLPGAPGDPGTLWNNAGVVTIS